MTRNRIAITIAAVTMMAGTLLTSAPVGAEGGLTLEERVQRLERRSEMPPPAAAPAPSGLQERLDALEAAIKKPPFGLTIGGMVVTSYLYDFNDPISDTVSLRSFDKNHNSFVLDLFQLQVSRAPGDNGVGFVTKVDFGKTAEFLGGGTDWDGSGTFGNVAEEQNSIELQDAYITYNFPGLPELGVKAGKFATMHGAEVIESPLNHNISRGLAFSFAIPFTHTGAMMSFAPTEMLSFTGGIVNGWDNVVDSNDGKSFHGMMGFTPSEQFALVLGGTYGPEQADRGDSKRGLVDVVATVKPVENLALVLNYDWGHETELDAATSGTAEWHAVSGIIAVDVPDVFAVPVGFALRGEYFDDSDGTRLTPGAPGGPYQNAWEVTATGKIVLAEGLMFRTEYRYDAAKHDLYEQGFRNVTNFQDDQHTVAAELSYVF